MIIARHSKYKSLIESKFGFILHHYRILVKNIYDSKIIKYYEIYRP